MINFENQLLTEIEDLTTACKRSGYSQEDINYLVEVLQDNNRANTLLRNKLIATAGKMLTEYGNFTTDRTDEILSKITGRAFSYIRNIRNNKEYQTKTL